MTCASEVILARGLGATARVLTCAPRPARPSPRVLVATSVPRRPHRSPAGGHVSSTVVVRVPVPIAAGADPRPGHVPDLSRDVAVMALCTYGLEPRWSAGTISSARPSPGFTAVVDEVDAVLGLATPLAEGDGRVGGLAGVRVLMSDVEGSREAQDVAST